MQEKMCNFVVMCLGLAILIVILSSCSPASPQLQLNAKADGTLVSLAKGQVFTLELESNPSTGYRWDVAQLDQAILQQEGEAEYKAANPADKNIVGAGGVETFRFKAVAPGQVSLKLIYHRTWEKDVPPVKTITLSVNIR